MQHGTWQSVRTTIRGAALALGTLHVVTYVVVALLRMRYPFELEWMEGGVVEHVRRVLAGQPVYAPPSMEFVSFLYPPLHYWVGAAASSILGIGFFPLRLVSFLASLGAFALVFMLVRRETGDAVAALVAACLFAATFERTGAWFDLARVDSLFLLVLLGAVYLARFAGSITGRAAAGVLVAVAFLGKQAAAVVMFPVAALALVREGRRGLPLPAVAAAGIAASIFALDAATGGWFRYYCFTMPAKHPIQYATLWGFWTTDILAPLGIAAAFAIFYLVARLASPGDNAAHFYLALAIGTAVSSWSVRSKLWAEANNNLPAYAAIAILAGLGVHEARRWIGGESGYRGRVADVVLWALVFVQLAALCYNPVRLVPTDEDRRAGQEVVDAIAAIEGDVWIPHHGYLAVMAGKRAFAHTLAVDNLFLDDPEVGGIALQRELSGAIDEQRFAAVLLDSDSRFAELVKPRYELGRDLFGDRAVFWTVAGYRVRPAYLCVPRR